jgi:uncharacterized membrane protein YagU involved in acid resistance
MTAVMLRLHQDLPAAERQPLPPREITEKLLEGAGVAGEISEEQTTALTWSSHFSYGARVGAIYGLAAPLLPGPKVLSGGFFGLLIWLDSYMGWLPLFRVLPPATREAPRRNLLMIAAHLVWGAATGIVAGLLLRPSGAAVKHRS